MREFDLNIEQVLENWTVAHALRATRRPWASGSQQGAKGLCGVPCGRGLRADYRQPEPDERPALHPGHPGDGERCPRPARSRAQH